MIKFYTYLFACAYVNAERQWKTDQPNAFHVFSAWMTVTVTVLFNIASLCFSIPVLLDLPHVRVPSTGSVVVPIMFGLASVCWLLFVRNGAGVRLAEELKKKGDDSIVRCQLVTYATPLSSAALFFITLVLAAHLHPPSRSQVHGDGSYASPIQSQVR